jgi:cytochrome c peroxidase
MQSNDSIMAACIKSVGMLDSTARLLGYGGGEARKFVLGALERYMLSIATRRTRYDDHLAGNGTLSAAELRGLRLFNGKAQCASCHPAPDFTDNIYHDNGLYRQRSIVESYSEEGSIKTRLGMDYGRGNVAAGRDNLHRFRTPSLYNAALTAPYMHNGSLPTLEAVLDFYDRGGDGPDAGNNMLDLTREEKRDLIAFLNTLTDVRYAEPETGSEEVSVR